MHYGTVLDVVQLAATSTADVTFAWFATASIANGMLSWAVANKMPMLSNMKSEITGTGKVLSNIVAGPADIVFRWYGTLGTGINVVLEVL